MIVDTPDHIDQPKIAAKAMTLFAPTLPPSLRHPQGAFSCWVVVECREQDAEEALTMTETAMLDGMKQLAKDCPVEVEGAIGKTWGSAK